MLPFLLLELRQALQKSNDSAVGLDDIHNKLLLISQKVLSPFSSQFLTPLGNLEYFCPLGKKPL